MDEPLPADLESAHAAIRQLRAQLAQARALLRNIMGYDPTDTSAVFAYDQAMRKAMAQVAPVAPKLKRNKK